MTAAGPSTGRRLLTKLGIALGVLVVALALVEVGLRVAGFSFRLYPERLRVGYPDPELIEEGYFHPHERFLFVNRKYEGQLAAAQAHHPDLVMLGCSCTEWGEYDLTLAKLAERAGTPLDIANFGCSGWTTFSGLRQLEDDVLPLKPRVVTIYFGWNDHWVGFGVEDKVLAELTASPLKMELQKLRLVQWISKLVLSGKAEQQMERGQGARPERVSLPDFKANLAEMVELARAHDITPVFITAPDAHVEGQEPEYLAGRYLQDISRLVPLHDAYVNAVREVAAEQDVVLCDLAAAFDALPRKTLLRNMKDDGIHLTQEFGGPAAGRLLYQTLDEHGLL